MPNIKPAPSKAFWPIFTFYFLFVVVGIGDMIFSPKYVVLNSFDFIINNYYYYFLPFSILFSYLVLDIFYKHHEYLILSIGFKILIHLFSIVLISWGIVGIIDFTNKLPSKSTPYTLNGKIIELYKKYPSKGYKRTYDKIRYFVTILEFNTEKEYDLQIPETLYDSIELDSKSPKIIHDSLQNKLKVIPSNEITLQLKMGGLGIIY